MNTPHLPSGMRDGSLDRLIRIQAWRAVDATIEAGVTRYARMQHLPPLLRLWPVELEGEEPAITVTVLDHLRKALQQQRRKARQAGGGRGKAGYDVNRHIALLQAWRAECRYWRDMKRHHEHRGRDQA